MTSLSGSIFTTPTQEVRNFEEGLMNDMLLMLTKIVQSRNSDALTTADITLLTAYCNNMIDSMEDYRTLLDKV